MLKYILLAMTMLNSFNAVIAYKNGDLGWMTFDIVLAVWMCVLYKKQVNYEKG